jgi:putative transposase
MEADIQGLFGAGRHERAEQRTTWRNGFCGRILDTRLGTLNLKAPKVRQGSHLPGLIETRKTSEQALAPVIQDEADQPDPPADARSAVRIGGVSTRKVDDRLPRNRRLQ